RARLDLDRFCGAVPDRVEVRRLHAAFDNDVSGNAREYVRRAARERVARVDDARAFVDVERDGVGDVFGFFLARGNGGCNRLTGKAHDALGEDGLAYRLVIELVQHRRDLLHAREIGGGDDGRAIGRRDGFDLSGGSG